MTPRPPSRTSLAVVVLCLVAAAGAAAEDLRDLLPLVAAQARAPHPLRADLRIERGGAPAVAAVILERGRRRYVETRAGERALLSPGKVVVVRDGRLARAAPGAALAGSDVLLEDLAPFGARTLDMPQVSDEGPTGVVVTGAPAPPTAYALLVHTIDPEDATIVKTKYYRESITNLVKIGRSDELVRVGERWRPNVIAVESFRPEGTTRLALDWREAPDAPAAVFTPAGLRAPSPITWP